MLGILLTKSIRGFFGQDDETEVKSALWISVELWVEVPVFNFILLVWIRLGHSIVQEDAFDFLELVVIFKGNVMGCGTYGYIGI